MKNRSVFFLSVSLCLGMTVASANAQQWAGDDAKHGNSKDPIETFAVLPSGAPGHPEGICADNAGRIYVNSFELAPSPTATATDASSKAVASYPEFSKRFPKWKVGYREKLSPPFAQNYIYTYNQNGVLISATPLPAGAVPLGCAVSGRKFFVNDVISGNELMYTLPLNDSSVPDTTFPICGGFVGNAGGFCALNANVVGPDGRVYMSDNGDDADPFFQTKGRIWVLDPKTGAASVFIDPPELDVVPNGYTVFGVNGVAFSHDGSALYMANMSAGTIYKLKVNHCATACEPGAFTLFSNDNRIQGPDNMDFDDDGNLWVASGQNHSVIELNKRGKVVGQFGAFEGFTKNGAPKGLLQPSGVIFSRGKIYIGNESNQGLLKDTKGIDFSKLKLFTVSRLDVDADGWWEW